MYPVLDAVLLHGYLLIQAAGRLRYHFLFRCGERTRLVGKAVDGRRIAIGRNQRRECLHQVPRRTVNHGFQAGVNIFSRASSPFFAARNQFDFNHSLGPQRHRDFAVEVLLGGGYVNAVAFAQRRQHLGTAHDLRKVRRTDFFFTLGNKHQIDGQLPAGAANGVHRGQEGSLRTLLVDRPTPDHALAQARLIDNGRVEGRRRPFRWIDLLDVIHEVDPEGARGAGVERGENAGLAIGGDFRRSLEAGLAQHAHGQVAAFVHAAVLGGNRRLANPRLQALHRFVMALLDFLLNGRKIGIGAGRERFLGEGKRGCAGGGGLKKRSSVHAREDNPKAWRVSSTRVSRSTSKSMNHQGHEVSRRKTLKEGIEAETFVDLRVLGGSCSWLLRFRTPGGRDTQSIAIPASYCNHRHPVLAS